MSAPVLDAVGVDPLEEARAAVAVGLWVSATRCLITYLIAPGLGLLGMAIGTAGVALQLLGAVTCASGALRLHRHGHRAWPVYATVALVVALTSALAVAGLLS